MTAQEIRSTVKVCMFDQYGTVVDMQGGLVEAATPYLRAKGWQGNPSVPLSASDRGQGRGLCRD